MKIRTPLFVLLALMVVVPDRGTTLVHLSLSQLSRAAAVIVKGRATRQEYGWNAGHSMIMTLTTFSVDDLEKGSALKTLVVEEPGGVMGNIQMRMDGTAHFYPQASYILFLEPSHSGADRFMPVGMMEGAFRTYRDAATGIEHVIPPVQGQLDAAFGTSSMKLAEMPTVSQFESRIRGILESPIHIPHGTALKIKLASGWNGSEGSGAAVAGGAGVPARHRSSYGRDGRATISRAVEARTAGTAFPSSDLVIPDGSSLGGEACRMRHGWRIRWTWLDIRGQKTKFAAVSNLAAGTSWQGAVLNVVAE